jgi:sulfonate transport system substrate-binding protein
MIAFSSWHSRLDNLMKRREFLKLSLGAAAVAVQSRRARAEAGFTRGSSAHNVIVQTLEEAGLTCADITPVYLTPPDAGPAFANGSIDAWSVWDPYLAIGEIRQKGRILVNASDITKTNSFYIANRDFAKSQGPVLRQIIDVTISIAKWAEAHRDDVAKSLSAVTGISLDIQTVAAKRSSFAVGPITNDIVATQQAVADRFFRLGLIPKPVVVRDALWKPQQS